MLFLASEIEVQVVGGCVINTLRPRLNTHQQESRLATCYGSNWGTWPAPTTVLLSSYAGRHLVPGDTGQRIPSLVDGKKKCHDTQVINQDLYKHSTWLWCAFSCLSISSSPTSSNSTSTPIHVIRPRYMYGWAPCMVSWVLEYPAKLDYRQNRQKNK